jgi:hypothetical protein
MAELVVLQATCGGGRALLLEPVVRALYQVDCGSFCASDTSGGCAQSGLCPS